MTGDDNLTPEERAAQLLGKLQGAAPPTAQPASPAFDPDDIPEPDEGNYQRTELDQQIDDLIAGIDIVEAYTRFINKSTPKPGRRHESIMVSCPNPAHPDANPSAWLNRDKGVWYCGGCQMGGDVYDFAAWHFGYNVPGYRTDKTFPQLRKDLGEAYGVTVVRGITGQEYVVTNDPEPEAAPAPSNVVNLPPPPALVPDDTSAPVAPVVTIPGQEDPDVDPDDVMQISDQDLNNLYIDWHSIAPEGTFLHEWMEAVEPDDLPRQYYFWLGMQALGFACQRDAVLRDMRDVQGNLNVCTYGPTGSGKSRANEPYMRLIKAAFPWTAPDHFDDPTGVLVIPTPGSGEALADSLTFEVLDPSNNQLDHQASVNGLLKVEEFSSFMARASRAGSSLKELIIELYDIYHDDIVLHSRGSGLVKVHNPFVQILTTTQPKAIHNYLRQSDTESGFLNRWVFAAGRPYRAPLAYGGFVIDITVATEKLRECRAFAEAGRTFTLAGDALEEWESFFHRRIASMKTGDVEMDSMASRIDLTLKKLMVLLTVNSKLPNPTPEIVQAACSLFDYLMTTYSMFSRDISFTENVECQNRIVALVESFNDKYGRNPTRRDIHRLVGKRFDLEMVDRAMKTLVSMEVLVEDVSKPKTGRPTTRYSVGA